MNSELRFEQLKDREEAVKLLTLATRLFIDDSDLAVRVVTTPEDILAVPAGSEFKYSGHTWGSLDDAKHSMKEGTSVTVVVVEKDGVLVGYGVAEKEMDEETTEVEIIDVDRWARRSRRFFREIELEGNQFQVGVAHVVVLALMENTKRPVRTDATNPASRYAFKSLGFIHDETTSNPCILRFG